MAKKILVIDDEGIVIKTVGNLLKREGYLAEVVNNGFQAIETVKDNDFDLIIADIRMPNIDGVTTIKKIKENLRENKKADIPTIFITGYADSDAHIKAREFGKVLFKPFDLTEFLDAVKEALN